MLRPDSRVPPNRAQRVAVHGQAPRQPEVRKQPRGVSVAIATTFGIAVAYLGMAKLGMAVGHTHPTAEASWPAAGLALAAVMLGGYRLLAGVALGAFLANLTTTASFAAALGITAGITLAAAIGVALLRRAGFRLALERMRDVIALGVLAGVISTAIGATISVGALLAFGGLTFSHAAGTWRLWWLGDMSGVLLLASALFVLTSTPVSRGRLRPGIARAVPCVLLAAISGAALSSRGPVAYIVFPTLFLLALLYRQQGAALGGLIIAGVAVWLTASGWGPSIVGSHDTALVRVLTLVSMGTVGSLLVAAARSERLLAEAAVRRVEDSERKLAEAQRLARIGSFEWDIAADHTTWSDELFHIFGLDRGQHPASYDSWRELIHEDDRMLVDGAIQRAHDTCEPCSFVHRIIRPDGHMRTLECHGRVEVDDRGSPIRMLGTAQDVTAVKLAEERFRSLFETAPYGLVVVDGEGEVVLANSETEQLFGYSRMELIGKAVEELVPGGANPWYRQPLQTRELERQAQRKDGSRFPVEISLTTLRTEEETLVSAAIKDVTERTLAAEELAHQASHDPLTGLPNRVLFLDRLDHALRRARRSGRNLAVIFLDLDDFKLVNDTFGHDIGDLLLLGLTPRLRAALRPGDTIARFGGDEFVVLCEDLNGEADALHIADRISDACREPVVVGGRAHAITVSAGVVLVVDPLSANPSSVLRDADAAMYRAKAGGKGRIEMFDEVMRARLIERFGIESQLRRALERDELRLYFQPVVSLRSGQVVAVEALVRWQHPERGLLEPAEFIGVAHSSGLVAQIDEWVIEQACHQAATWQDRDSDREPIHVSVNVSPRRVVRSDVASMVAKKLESSGLDPKLLELEITENTLLEDADACARSLRELKALGVRLVLDDFGTGYSSLSSLRQLTIDALKIDRSFVEGLGRDGEDGAIVNAVLSMADALDVGVTAEGVETDDQLARLREQGCEFAQGFLFGRPAPAERVATLIGADELEELSA